MSKSTFDVFASYVEPDSAWVEGFLLEALGRARIRCHSKRDFALGVPELVEFERAIKTSDLIILVISAAYLQESPLRFVEVMAQSFGAHERTWPVVPILRGPVNELPFRLRQLSLLDATEQANWETVVERVCKRIRVPTPQRSPIPDCP